MKKLVLILALSLSACSLFDKGKPCPPVVVCPPPIVCPTPEPPPVPTPCPTPEPPPVPTPCPTPEPTPVPTECPPVVVCPPEKVCPEGLPYPTQTEGSPCWDYSNNNILNYYMLNRAEKYKTCMEATYAITEKAKVEPTPIPQLPSVNSVIIYDAEPQCSPTISTITLPSRTKTDCIQAATGQALKNLILTKNIQPGTKSPCYPFFGQMYENCIDVAVRNYPVISYGLSGHYLKGSLYGQPWEGCAAGISGNPIRVSLAQPPRELSLIAWESANYWMWITMDRLDLTDGDYIAQATNTAMAACNL